MTAAVALLAALVLLAVPVAAQAPAPSISAHLALENDAVRVMLLTMPAGTASGRHSGLEPELGMVIEGELTLVTDAGREVLPVGTARWLPSLMPHDARNETDRPVRLWVVLFKRCGDRPAAIDSGIGRR
jgi:quercetin dioxygenase-like cupin family protein